jgi:2',3'-cyclic-nucleotide 2'-phosphodiesterase (5'-nucleotidase family)
MQPRSERPAGPWRAAGTSVLAAFVCVITLAACSASRGPVRGTTPALPTVTPTASRPVRVLLVNDVYVSDTLRDGSGGLARVAAWRDSVEDQHGERVLLLFAGDGFSPSLLSKWYAGQQMVEAFNRARVDYGTLGNHEFDVDRDQFTARVQESRFPWLSANCRYGDGTAFPNVRGWDTVTVSGTRVGIFGTTVLAEYRSWVQCTDPDVAAKAAVDTLQSLGVELVVALTHQFIFHDSATLVREPRITLLMGGHEHDGRRFAHDGRLLIKAASNARTAAYVEATRRGNGWSLRDTIIRPARGWTEQSATAEVTAAWRDTLVRRIGTDRVLGVAPEVIDAVDSTSRGGESRFGNMVADAYRFGTSADVALLNSGAMRLDDLLGPGPITAHELESIFLFADETRIVTVPLSGARLRELLEHGVSQRRLGTGAYPQVSGVRFTFDARLPSGSRLVGPMRREDGREIRDRDVLRVSLPSFPACRGGDGYVIPEARAICAAYEADNSTAPRSAALLVQHVEGMRGRIVPPPTGRVERLDARRGARE